MARKKNNTSKQPQNENKPQAKTKPQDETARGASASTPNAGAQSAEAMSVRAMEMWREQMSAMLSGPQAFQGMGKAFEPFTQLFTQGANLWLMMMEQTGRMADGFGGFGTGNGAQENAYQNTQQGQSRAGRATGDVAHGSPAASALSGASTYAVAQLAARVADLEKRLDALTQAQGKPATGNAKPAAPRSRRKAKIITLRPAGTGSQRS